MPVSVSDRGSNKPELIEHAAEVIGQSAHRAAVFRAIYTGKSPVKTVVHLMDVTELPRTRVLDAGKKLADQDIVEQIKEKGLTAYRKIAFFQTHREKILRYARDPSARTKVVTKRRPESSAARKTKTVTVVLKAAARQLQALPITVDDVESFKQVGKVAGPKPYVAMPETRFKNGVAKLLGETATFKDWGGESRDLFSTRIKINGRRRLVAFAFKGPGTKGRLTPGKMGKNGDQIQRLMRCPAEVFFVQYWAEIDDAVLEQLQRFAELRSYLEQKEILFGVIDGSDSARLIEAYPKAFAARRKS